MQHKTVRLGERESPKFKTEEALFIRLIRLIGQHAWHGSAMKINGYMDEWLGGKYAAWPIGQD